MLTILGVSIEMMRWSPSVICESAAKTAKSSPWIPTSVVMIHLVRLLTLVLYQLSFLDRRREVL